MSIRSSPLFRLDSTMYPHFAGPVLQQLLEGPQAAADGGGAGRQAAGQEGRAARPRTAERAVSNKWISTVLKLRLVMLPV